MKPSIQNIVVCFDGTKKELTSSKQSNILKFFDLLSNEGDQKVLYYVCSKPLTSCHITQF